jgi:hypothetical protein
VGWIRAIRHRTFPGGKISFPIIRARARYKQRKMCPSAAIIDETLQSLIVAENRTDQGITR